MISSARGWEFTHPLVFERCFSYMLKRLFIYLKGGDFHAEVMQKEW